MKGDPSRPPLVEKIADPFTRPQVRQTLLLLGSGPIYLAALGENPALADHQLLAAVSMEHPHLDALRLYQEDRRITGEPVYTVETQPLALDDWLGPLGLRPGGASFEGTIYRGDSRHLGQPILRKVSFKVSRILYGRKLRPSTNPLAGPSRYFVFGSRHELFAYKVRRRPEEAEYLVSIRFRQGVPSEAQAERLRAGSFLQVPEDAPLDRLSVGSIREGLAFTHALDLPVTVETLGVHYESPPSPDR